MQPDKIQIDIVAGKRVIRWIRIDGETRTQAGWRKLPEVTVSKSGMRKRIKNGWPAKRAVFEPSRGNAGTVQSKLAHPERVSLDSVIMEHYPEGGSTACLPHLSGVTASQIASRANRIGVRSNDLREFCKNRAQNKPTPVVLDPDKLTSQPWMPIEVVRWIDEVTP